MIYKSEKLQRNHITNFFKNCINDFDFKVCDGKIDGHKENYFRIYVDGNLNEYLELYFVGGNLRSFGYLCKGFGRNIEVTEHGNYRVNNSIPPAVKAFMSHMVNVLNDKVEEYGEDLNANEQKFLNIITKLV